MNTRSSLLLLVIALSGCSLTSRLTGPIDRQPAQFSLGARTLEEADILKVASSGPLRIEKARLITDNDASFDSKLEAIRSARAGETIRLAYYIYSQDHSSSVFSEELIRAAKRGVKVRLLVDIVTNYKNLDLFSYLESEGGGQIEVKLYGRPNSIIVRDAIYLTQPCPESKEPVTPKTCSSYKWKELAGGSPDYFAKLLLSGLYSQNGQAISTAILKGQQIDIKTYTEGSSISDEEQKSLQEFFKLLYQARAHDDIEAKIKVAIALQTYGEKLNPILNELYGRLPIEQMGESSAREWEHITDFIHHKILLVENRFVQLGGRNIENSYHMRQNDMTAKYIFMDTDMAINLSAGGESIAAAFDALWDFDSMTLPISTVRKIMPNDFIENAEIAKTVLSSCLPPSYHTPEQRQQLMMCVEKGIESHPNFLNLKKRMVLVKNHMSSAANRYRQEYAPTKKYTETWRQNKRQYSDQLDNQDVSQMVVAYIENLPFNRRQNPADRTRIYGVTSGREIKSGKYIHHLWYRGLENTCAVAAEELKRDPKALPKRVILHSAYFIPPALLLKGFTKMMDGSWDCKNVRVTFLTNSMESTDLGYINILARYQMMAFFGVYATRNGHFGSNSASRSASFDYFEYKGIEGRSKRSLHTKLSVLGDDMIIGSANADARSYYMDTNNGFYLHNVKDLTKEYAAWVDSLLRDQTKIKDLTEEYTSGPLTKDRLISEDKVIVDTFLKKWQGESKKKEKTRELASKTLSAFGSFIVNATHTIMSKEYVVEWGDNETEIDRKKLQKQTEMENRLNRLLQVF